MGDVGPLEAAYVDQDWHAVLRLATANPRGDEALLVGHAHWHLGSVAEALHWLELGLSESERSPGNLSPFRYAAGMARLLRSDPAGGRRHLQGALEGPADDPWRFPTLRGMAQVEMELGLLDAAGHRLRHLPHDGPGQALQHVMRAKVAWRAGRVEQARGNLWIALRHAIAAAGAPTGAGDSYQLIDEATLLVSGAEILAAMGHGAECHRALDRAEALLEAAEAPGLPVEAHLRLCRATAHRLTGEPEIAETLLDTVEAVARATEARDLSAAVARERARMRWDRGDLGQARSDLAEAAGQFEGIGYAWEAEATRTEATTGPPAFVPAEPLERWFREDAWLDEAPPIGVVVSLIIPPGEDLPELIGDLAEALAARLEDNTQGYVDGWGTDGEELEVFVYGDDPDVLWQAMEKPVRELELDGTVRMEWGRRFAILLLHPPEELSELRRIRPLLPVLPRRDATPPLTMIAIAAAAAATTAAADPDVEGPLPDDLEWVRSARLEWGRVWLWRWAHPLQERYVTLLSNPGAPPVVQTDPCEGLTPEQHLISIRYGFRSHRPTHLW